MYEFFVHMPKFDQKKWSEVIGMFDFKRKILSVWNLSNHREYHLLFLSVGRLLFETFDIDIS